MPDRSAGAADANPDAAARYPGRHEPSFGPGTGSHPLGGPPATVPDGWPATEGARDPGVPVEPGRVDPGPAARWRGRFEEFVVGDPGNAHGAVVDRLDRAVPDRNDTVVDGVSLQAGAGGPWLHLRAASVRGLSHRAGGKVRQDEYAFRQTADGRYLVVAVADGVSEGEHSHVAATIAARQGCALVDGWLQDRGPEQLPWRDVLAALCDDIDRNGRKLLLRRGVDVHEWGVGEIARALATTLVIGVVDLHTEPDGYHPVFVTRVGDASAWLLCEGGWHNLYEIKNHGQSISSAATSALPSLSSVESPVRTYVARGEAVVFMTDGVGDPLDDGRNDFAAFLADVWSAPPAPLAFAAHVDFARKSFDDDRTAVAIWPT